MEARDRALPMPLADGKPLLSWLRMSQLARTCRLLEMGRKSLATRLLGPAGGKFVVSGVGDCAGICILASASWQRKQAGRFRLDMAGKIFADEVGGVDDPV